MKTKFSIIFTDEADDERGYYFRLDGLTKGAVGYLENFDELFEGGDARLVNFDDISIYRSTTGQEWHVEVFNVDSGGQKRVDLTLVSSSGVAEDILVGRPELYTRSDLVLYIGDQETIGSGDRFDLQTITGKTVANLFELVDGASQKNNYKASTMISADWRDAEPYFTSIGGGFGAEVSFFDEYQDRSANNRGVAVWKLGIPNSKIIDGFSDGSVGRDFIINNLQNDITDGLNKFVQLRLKAVIINLPTDHANLVEAYTEFIDWFRSYYDMPELRFILTERAPVTSQEVQDVAFKIPNTGMIGDYYERRGMCGYYDQINYFRKDDLYDDVAMQTYPDYYNIFVWKKKYNLDFSTPSEPIYIGLEANTEVATPKWAQINFGVGRNTLNGLSFPQNRPSINTWFERCETNKNLTRQDVLDINNISLNEYWELPISRVLNPSYDNELYHQTLIYRNGIFEDAHNVARYVGFNNSLQRPILYLGNDAWATLPLEPLYEKDMTMHTGDQSVFIEIPMIDGNTWYTETFPLSAHSGSVLINQTTNNVGFFKVVTSFKPDIYDFRASIKDRITIYSNPIGYDQDGNPILGPAWLSESTRREYRKAYLPYYSSRKNQFFGRGFQKIELSYISPLNAITESRKNVRVVLSHDLGRVGNNLTTESQIELGKRYVSQSLPKPDAQDLGAFNPFMWISGESGFSGDYRRIENKGYGGTVSHVAGDQSIRVVTPSTDGRKAFLIQGDCYKTRTEWDKSFKCVMFVAQATEATQGKIFLETGFPARFLMHYPWDNGKIYFDINVLGGAGVENRRMAVNKNAFQKNIVTAIFDGTEGYAALRINGAEERIDLHRTGDYVSETSAYLQLFGSYAPNQTCTPPPNALINPCDPITGGYLNKIKWQQRVLVYEMAAFANPLSRQDVLNAESILRLKYGI